MARGVWEDAGSSFVFVKTVLVADDHPDLLDLVQFVLESHGFRVVVAHDGVEAIEAVERQPPDAVVMDVWMPRLDGIAATQHIRRHHPQVPIIAHTAHPGTLEGHTALFDDVCVKPCTEKLIELLRALMK